jgi:hypothetical protein
LYTSKRCRYITCMPRGLRTELVLYAKSGLRHSWRSHWSQLNRNIKNVTTAANKLDKMHISHKIKVHISCFCCITKTFSKYSYGHLLKPLATLLTSWTFRPSNKTSGSLLGQRNKSLTLHTSYLYIKHVKLPEGKFPNSVPGPEEPAAVTLPARRSSDEFRDSDILCSCLIMTNRKLKYSMRWSSPWFWSSRNSRTHLDINIVIKEYCWQQKIVLRT